MQKIDVIIPVFWVSFETIRNKLIPFLQIAPEEAEINVIAYCPPPEKSYVYGTEDLIDVESEYAKSLEQWLVNLDKALGAVRDKSRPVTVTDKDLAKWWRANGGEKNSSLLVLLLGERNMLPLYRSIIRATNVPVLVLFNKPWRPPLNIVAAIDPFHDSDAESERDIRVVTSCRELSKALSARVTLLHCCNVPVYLAEHRRSVCNYRRESIREFAETNGFRSLGLAVVNGAPETEIRSYVNKSDVDILGMGSVSRGFWERYILGSTADELLTNPPCDLLLLRT